MKKYVIIVLAAVMAACTNERVNEEAEAKRVTFRMAGDMAFMPNTRASLQDVNMTDLWVFDYVDGTCVQSVHQASTDADFGAPSLLLTYGTHHVYFVASRGGSPTVNESGHTITWDTPRDTFWEDYEVDVSSSSSASHTVTMHRAATRLRVNIKDEVPAECAQLSLTPATWYAGLDYVSGLAVGGAAKEFTVTVPASYAGTSNQLSMTVYGLSDTDEWTSDVSLRALADDGEELGHVTIVAAPFKRNRATEYSGNLFNASGSIGVSLDDTWEQSYVGEW